MRLFSQAFLFALLVFTAVPALPLADNTALPLVYAQTVFPGDSAGQLQAQQIPGASGLPAFMEGSLLGKLLFNQPFERASMLDILVILVLAFIISKIISRNAQGSGPSAADRYGQPDDENRSGSPAPPPPGYDPWARLRSKPEQQSGKGKTIPFPTAESSQGSNQMPGQSRHAEGGFPEAQAQAVPQANSTRRGAGRNDLRDGEFLQGAKLLYVRLHEAWKNQDLEFIRHFTSPSAYQKFLHRDPQACLDIIKIEAVIVKEEMRGAEPFVTVEFDVLARISGQAGPPAAIREYWSFLEPAATGAWRLEEF